MPKEAIMNRFYITTAIPYVNAPPHIGHALEFVQADVIARYHHLIGDDAILLSGGDENALKNVQAAEKAKIPVQEFIDENGECFEHPGKKLEEVSEENYFFKLSKYQDQLLELLETGRLRIIPESRKN